MFIQDQLDHRDLTDENLAFYRAIGVDYLTIYPPPFGPQGTLKTRVEMVEYLRAARRQAETHGLQLRNLALAGPDDITLARPGREAAIGQWCDVLRAMGDVGVPTLGYNFKPIGNFRTSSTTGRGGAQYSTFDRAEWERTQPEYPASKHVDEAGMWAHLEYFLQRVIPVAEECGVRLALHPDDPPIPEPLGGAARIVSTLDQYERIFALAPSPSNAMLFCQGCVTEMGVDVYEAIRRMGRLDKIVYVHFRNVRGSGSHFEEVFVDEGDVDMVRAMQTYRQVGFEGPFMMDHTPHIPGDERARAGHALATGYMRALIQAAYR
ncbi:MAG: mannonate dehydratase [Candidatus Latescibacterota bacterium]